MAADVGHLVRILNGYNEEQQRKQQVMSMSNSNSTDQTGKSRVLVTRDLLGGSGGGGSFPSTNTTFTKLGSKELDLDSQVPNGWEKRLDMKSGKLYLQRCNSEKSSSSSSSDQNQNHQKKKQSRMIPELQDLNFPPSPPPTTTTIIKSKNLLTEEDENLDLKLVVPSNYDYHQQQMMSTPSNVCTLDKVKSALERAEKESASSSLPFLGLQKKRSISISTEKTTISSSSCSSYSSSSSSSNLMKKQDEEAEEKKMKVSSSSSNGSGLLFAAGCPGCLSYVLISKMSPKCPRCESIIPSPPCNSTPTKKPRIDLNISI